MSESALLRAAKMCSVYQLCQSRTLSRIVTAVCGPIAGYAGCSTLIHDCDGMFVKDFDNTLRGRGIDAKKVGPRAPNMNAFVERWIQSIKQEALNHFMVCGERHYNYLISEYLAYYMRFRPHQALGNKPLTGRWPDAEAPPPLPGDIVCHKQLGGLLKHYYRKSA